MIVVFGATGRTGGEAARTLLRRGRKVRAVARDRDRLRSLEQLGAEACVADLEQPDDVKRALAGASAAYLLCPPNLTTPDFRAYQRRVTAALVQGVRSSRVGYLVLLSSLGAEHAEGTGPIVGLHELEEQLKDLPEKSTLAIRAGFFMENFLMNVEMVRSMKVFGAPIPPELPLPLVGAADIGQYAAARLAALDFQGTERVSLLGPGLLRPDQVAAALGAAIGNPDLPYVQFSYDDAEKGLLQAGLPPQLAMLYVEMYRGFAAGLVAPEPGTRVVNTQTPFETFAKTFAAVYERMAPN